jgi:hypothetical protein
MNLDELNNALSASDPDPSMVLAEFERKRRRRHERYQRLLAASGGLAVVVVLIVGVGLLAHAPSSSSSSSPAGGTAARAPVSSAPAAASGAGRAAQGGTQKNGAVVPSPSRQYSASSGSGSSGSCAANPLKQAIADALRHGGSVIVATGTLTGKSVTGSPATGAAAFYAMRLSSVQTLRGPAVASGSTAWIPGPAPGASASVTSALLAPGGRLFAIVSPKAASHALVGPTLRLAPIVGADVVFTPSSCWDVTALQPSQYQASTPLLSVPDGAAIGGAHQPAENRLYAVPLATVEQVAAQA